MKPSQEFVVGNHKIGYVSSDFTKAFKEKDFNEKKMPSFQKLGRRMTDAQIETELKPGLCELGDVLAFLDNAPEECKDGNWNLFYFSAFVVFVRWGGGGWRVDTWGRDGHGWFAGRRVFSPATVSFETFSSNTISLDLSDIENLIEIVKKAGYVVYKKM